MEEGDFGDFVGSTFVSQSPKSVLKRAFGSLDGASAVCSTSGLDGEFPALWTSSVVVSSSSPSCSVSDALLREAVGMSGREKNHEDQEEESKGMLTVVDRLSVRKLVWNTEEDVTVGELALRAGVQELVDCVLVDSETDELIPHDLPCARHQMTVVVEPRLRFMIRTMPQLLERVAESERSFAKRHADIGPLLYAWRVIFDAGTWQNVRTSGRALVTETTRLDGVRHIPENVAQQKGNDLRGVAVHRKVRLIGVARMAWLVHVLFSDCALHLLQVGKITGDPVQVVLLQQKPVFYRSMHDVLVEPKAFGLRSRIDADQLSGLIVASFLTDMSSCRPSSVFLYYNGESVGVEIGAECLETAMQPFATLTNERGQETACVCNILWMLKEEMDRVVSTNVREYWLRLDVESVTLRLLEKVSSYNDQMHELFSDLCDGTVVPMLLRTGIATNLLNKAAKIQSLLRSSDQVTHADLFRNVLPELAQLYEAANVRAKNVLDTWRLLSYRSHIVTTEGVSVPADSDLKDRAQIVFGENIMSSSALLDRVRLRKAVEREQAAVKLVAEVLKQMN